MGYVYVMENESFKEGVLKIGKADSPEQRQQQLSSETAIPTPFKIVLKEYVENPYELENYIHRRLEKKRINPAREFFMTTAKEVKNLIDDYKQEIKNYDIKKRKIEIIGSPLVKVFPNSKDVFTSKQAIYDFFLNSIKEQRKEYHISKNINLSEGTMMWIKYGTELIGEAKVLENTKKIEKNVDFNKRLKLDPNSIKLYSTPIFYYDFVDFQETNKNHQAYHNVSYEVFYDLTKKLSDQSNIIAHRLEKNSAMIDISSEEDITWFKSKKIESILKERKKKFFNGLEEDAFDIEFAIYQENDIYYWDLAIYNNSNNDSESYINRIKIFLEDLKILKNYDEDYLVEDWGDENKKYIEIIKEEKLLQVDDNLTWDEILKKIEIRLEEVELNCLKLLGLD